MLFRSLTVSQSNCPDGVEYEMEEGEDGDGQVDYFAGESSIGAVWTVLDGVSVASAAGGDADEAFFVTRELQSSIHFQDLDYGFLDSAILIYERHGRLVMVYRVWGRCCHYGFNNEYLGVYTPTFDEASTSLEILRPHVLNSLPDK